MIYHVPIGNLNTPSSFCWLSTRASTTSFTLHAPDGARLVGFDNAHGVPARGSRFGRPPAASDHWHRTGDDPGRPYAFKDAETLLQDFFREVRRILTDRGIPEAVVRVEEKKR